MVDQKKNPVEKMKFMKPGAFYGSITWPSTPNRENKNEKQNFDWSAGNAGTFWIENY